MIQMITSIRARAMRKPEDRRQDARLHDLVPHALPLDDPPAVAAMAAPAMPPMRAWLELEGSPRNQVTRFHVIAPTRPASMTLSVTASGSTIPFATVAATFSETNAPAKLKIAETTTAVRGDSARVDTLVAIAFAVSWKPFVKSKKRATTMTATRVRSSMADEPQLLHDDVRDDVRCRLAGVERAFERLVDVLPADDDERVDALVAEERCERVAQHPVALVLEVLDLDERVLDAAHALEVVVGDRELLAGADDDPALLDRVPRRHLHAIQTEEVRCLLEVVDDVVDLGREEEDVVAVEGGDVLRVEERDQITSYLVTSRLLELHLLLRDARARMLAKPPLDHS